MVLNSSHIFHKPPCIFTAAFDNFSQKFVLVATIANANARVIKHNNKILITNIVSLKTACL